MKIIICGAGIVGSGIARHLTSEDNDVTIIDDSEELLKKMASRHDVKIIKGRSAYPEVLEEAGAAKADMLIAVTAEDELNMITCQISKSLFNVPRKIARVRNQNYLLPKHRHMFGHDQLPIDIVISPEIEVAQTIMHRFHAPGATEMHPIEGSNSRVLAAKVSAESLLLDRTYNYFMEKAANLNISILGVAQLDDIFIPTPEYIFREGDEIYFVTDFASELSAMRILGHEEAEAQSILIIGGGNIGHYIANAFEHEENSNFYLKMIELEKERAEEVAEKLDKTIVINGSALDQEILDEVSISNVETVIAVTNDDEVNILSSLLAKRMGAKKCITLINSIAYTPLIESLGIDVLVNPRETTVSSILSQIRRGMISAVHTVHGGRAEIIEAEISNKLEITGSKLSSLELPDGVTVGAIIRDDCFVKPSSMTILLPKDKLIIFSLPEHVKWVENLVSTK